MELKIAKIVGAADKTSWSQVHSFAPKDREKRESHGVLVAALSFKAKEKIEVSSFGTEIITRLQEIYYSNDSEQILKKISQTIESLAAEFWEAVSLQVVMSVFWEVEDKMFLYMGKSAGGGQGYIKRGEDLVKVLSQNQKEIIVVSGEMKEGDKVVLGTSDFFRMVPEGVLKTALEPDRVEESVEMLAPVVHGSEDNSQAAAAVVAGEEAVEGEVEETKELAREAEDKKEEIKEKREGVAEKIIKVLKRVTGLLGGFLKLKKSRGVELRPEGSKKRKSAATAAIILLVVFGAYLFLAGRKKAADRKEAEYQQLIESVEYRFSEGEGLLELNPLRAKSLLNEANGLLTDYESEHEGENEEEIKKWQEKIEELLERVQREYEVGAEEWFDFGLVKEGFKGGSWDGDESQVLVLDEDGGLILVNLETKSSDLVGGEEEADGSLTGFSNERGFVYGGGKIIILDVEDQEIVDEMEGDWGVIKAAEGFSGNLYLLKSETDGQILKFSGVESGLGKATDYLKGEAFDLSQAVDVAIDGSVYVLFNEGGVVKYTRGQKDAFGVTGLDEELGEPVKIYTDPEADFIYILDKAKTRVVVLDKSGEYKAQYVWSGIAGAEDILVNEELKKIYLLTAEKIFVIELRD